jgi:CRISPR/Cas system CMR-associated protein Cmr5 small subunit
MIKQRNKLMRGPFGSIARQIPGIALRNSQVKQEDRSLG